MEYLTYHSVKVDYGRDWTTMINQFGANIPVPPIPTPRMQGRCPLRKVGEYFPPSPIVENSDFVLRWFEGGGGWRSAMTWANRRGLLPTDPREVCSLVEQKTHLLKECGQEELYLVSTQPFQDVRRKNQFCTLNWRGELKGLMNIKFVTELEGLDVLFVFRKP